MQKRTKILLGTLTGFIILTGAIGVSKATEKMRSGFHGSSSFMQHGQMGSRTNMHEKIFEKFDSNKDGTITKAEIDAVRKSEIAKNDANKDGKLSLNEFETLWTGLMRERMVDHFQRLDNDGDAVLSEDEIAKPLDRMLSHMDRNNDGSLDKNELQRKGRGHHGMRGGHRDHDDDHGKK